MVRLARGACLESDAGASCSSANQGTKSIRLMCLQALLVAAARVRHALFTPSVRRPATNVFGAPERHPR